MIRTRFAPSPTGLLHIGHAHAAREAFNFAAEHQGIGLLRIEDTDHTRCIPAYESAIFEDLDWLGFDWPLPVRKQSQHFPAYARIVLDLLDRGLAYPCTLTRAEVQSGRRPSAENTQELGSLESIMNQVSESAYAEMPSLPFAIRLDLSKAINTLNDNILFFKETGPSHAGHVDILPKLMGKLDPIIARKDIGCSYMIAGPHDDWVQMISHVVRGEDLFQETPLQVLLQKLMGWPTPVYHHHRLVKSETGEKLSKRNLDTTLQSLRESGQTPQDIWDMTA